jgi:hypothetical protein
VDINDDGLKDLIVGDGAGYVNFFERNSDKTLKANNKIKANGAVLKLSEGTCPFMVDWNEDGLLDLVVGCTDKSMGVRLYLNSGTKKQYTFTDFTRLKAGGSNFGYERNQVKVVDLNHDGKKDLLVSSGLLDNPRLYYFENIGTNAEPELKAAVTLMTKNNRPVTADMDLFYDVGDWNNDGGWDIIAGGYEGPRIHLYLGDPHTGIISGKTAKNTAVNTFTWDVKRNHFTARVDLVKDQHIEFSVVTSSGRVIQKHRTNEKERGSHTIEFSITDSAPGVYFVLYYVNGITVNNRIIVTR